MDERRHRFRAPCSILALSFLLAVGTAEAGKLSLKAALKSISVEELKSHITFLASDALEGREAGTTGAWAASKYIIGELEKVDGLKKGDGGPGDDVKDWLQYFNGNFRNILVSLPGSDPDLKDEVILIGAHYDHVG